MQCPRCQHEAPPRAKFCPECAAPLPTRCAKCESDLPPGAKFCPQCAAPVGGAPAATRPEIGHCHALLALVSPSSEHAAGARRVFEELGMSFWSARL